MCSVQLDTPGTPPFFTAMSIQLLVNMYLVIWFASTESMIFPFTFESDMVYTATGSRNSPHSSIWDEAAICQIPAVCQKTSSPDDPDIFP